MNECLGEFIMCQGLCLLLPLTLTRLTLTITLWERAVPLQSWGNCNTEKLGDSPDSLSWLRAALCLTLLPSPLTASGRRRAEYTEARPVFHLGVLSYSYPGIIGSAEPFRVLSVWFKAQTGFPPLFFQIVSKGSFYIILILRSHKETKAMDSLKPLEGEIYHYIFGNVLLGLQTLWLSGWGGSEVTVQREADVTGPVAWVGPGHHLPSTWLWFSWDLPTFEEKDKDRKSQHLPYGAIVPRLFIIRTAGFELPWDLAWVIPSLLEPFSPPSMGLCQSLKIPQLPR